MRLVSMPCPDEGELLFWWALRVMLAAYLLLLSAVILPMQMIKQVVLSRKLEHSNNEAVHDGMT